MRALACGLGLLLCCSACGSDDSGPAKPGAGSDAASGSSAKDKLIDAFLKSACTRPIECGDPNAGQCTPFTKPQLEQGLASASWTDAQIAQCTAARETLVACIATADCAAVLSATACSAEKDAYSKSCAPLLTVLFP